MNFGGLGKSKLKKSNKTEPYAMCYDGKEGEARKTLFKNHTKLGKFIDPKTKKSKQILQISFDNVVWNEGEFKRNPKTNLFKWRAEGFDYVEIETEKLESILQDELFFEVILNGMPRKLFFDWDGKKCGTLISLAEAEELIDCFKLYLCGSHNINIKEIKCLIQVSIDIDDTLFYGKGGFNGVMPHDKTTKIFKSLHFIFNVYTNTHQEAKYIITDFINENTNPYAKLIDLTCYRNMKLMRTIGQRKEGRTDKLEFINYDLCIDKNAPMIQLQLDDLNKLYEKANSFKNNFITAITPTDIFLKPILKPLVKVGVETNYNLVFNINQLEPLKEIIKNLKYDDLHYNPKTRYNCWQYNLNLVINGLLMCGIKWEDILNHEYTQIFLKVSKENSTPNEYNNEVSYNSNVKFITDICEKKQKPPKIKNSKIFTELTLDEQGFIYKCLKKEPHEELVLTNRQINRSVFLDINSGGIDYDSKKMTNLTLYDTKLQTLLTLCDLENEVDKNNNTHTSIIVRGKPPTTPIASEGGEGGEDPPPQESTQFSFQFNEIAKLKEHTFTTQKPTKEFTNWDETKTNINLNAFYSAPVGSRKSSERMDKDIRAILTEPYNNHKILMVCEVITLSEAQEQRFIDIIKSLKLEDFTCYANTDITNQEEFEERQAQLLEGVRHYDKYKRERNLLTNENTKVLITTYDSLDKFKHLKFTHTLLDEYTNIRKRFTRVNDTNINKLQKVNLFFKHLEDSVIKCYDADLMSYDLKLLQKFSKKAFEYYCMREYKQVNNKIVLTNKNAIIKDILQSIAEGKKITISSNTKKEAHRIFDMVCEAMKHDDTFKCVVITGGENGSGGGAKTNTTSKVSNQLKKDLMRDTTLWGNYNVVIYTPTIMTGISFDSKIVFYKHYGFLCSSTTDFTQTAQMLYRVRGCITHTIMLCDTNNNIKSLYNYNEKPKELKRQYYYEMFLVKAQNSTDLKTNEEVNIYETDEFKSKQSILETYEEMADIEERRRKQFYYDLFFTLYKWGSTNLCFDFYDYKGDNAVKYKRKMDDQYTQKNFVAIDEYEDFVEIPYLDILTTTQTEDTQEKDLTPSEIKTITLRKYGYGALIYNNFQDKRITHPLHNAVIYDFITNTSHKNTFNKRKRLNNYKIKSIIYEMVKYCYVGINDFRKIYEAQKCLKETNIFLNFMVNCFVFFKICDLNYGEAENPYNTLMDNFLIEKKGKVSVNDLEKFKNELECLTPFVNYLVNKKLRKDTTLIATITHAFTYFCCDSNIAIDEPTNKAVINYTRQGILIRYEKENVLIEKGTHALQNTDYDDSKNWLDDNLFYESRYGRKIPYGYMPKIKMYNFYTESKENLRLKHYFNTYYNEAYSKKLTDLLNNFCIEQGRSQLKIMSSEAETLWESVVSETHEVVKHIFKDGSPKLNDNEKIKPTNLSNIYITTHARVFDKRQRTLKHGLVEEHYREINPQQILIPINVERIEEEDFKQMSSKYEGKMRIAVNYIVKKGQIYYVDRLVAEAFLDTYRTDMFVNHINMNYADDRAENLIMCEKWDSNAYGDLINTQKKEVKIKTAVVAENRRKEKVKCDICDKEVAYYTLKRHKTTHK